jgi:hypothetical protein
LQAAKAPLIERESSESKLVPGRGRPVHRTKVI